MLETVADVGVRLQVEDPVAAANARCEQPLIEHVTLEQRSRRGR